MRFELQVFAASRVVRMYCLLGLMPAFLLAFHCEVVGYTWEIPEMAKGRPKSFDGPDVWTLALPTV